MIKKSYVVALLFLICSFILTPSGLLAANTVPQPLGFVSDFANVMDNRSRAEIQLIAEALQREQGVELAVVTMSSVKPSTPMEYKTTLFNAWGVGGPEDSGVLILLDLEEREVVVEIGYGIEGALPDGKVGAILDQFVIPHFAQGNYGQGMVQGANALRAELLGESFVKAEAKPEASEWIRTFLIFIAIAIFISMRSRHLPPGGPSGRNRRYPMMGGGFGGSNRSGGGGFGGFGGGRSGGGGAGRKF